MTLSWASRLLLLLGASAAFLAILIQLQGREVLLMSCSIPCLSSLCKLHNPESPSDQAIASKSTTVANMARAATRTPVYFLSHGGYASQLSQSLLVPRLSSLANTSPADPTSSKTSNTQSTPNSNPSAAKSPKPSNPPPSSSSPRTGKASAISSRSTSPSPCH